MGEVKGPKEVVEDQSKVRNQSTNLSSRSLQVRVGKQFPLPRWLNKGEPGMKSTSIWQGLRSMLWAGLAVRKNSWK